MMVEQEVPADQAQKSKKNKKEEKLTLKTVLTKMVPYASFPYADHALRLCDADPNLKADATSESQIQTLILAAQKLRQLVKDMDTLDEIKGFIIFKPDTVRQVIGESDH